jgi:hypothetical protein
VSDKSLNSAKPKVNAVTKEDKKNFALHQLLRMLNRILRGWQAIFGPSPPSGAFPIWVTTRGGGSAGFERNAEDEHGNGCGAVIS